MIGSTTGFLQFMENLENLLIFVEVREKSWNLFWIMAKIIEKSWNLFPRSRIFSNRDGHFNGNSSNIRQRQVRLPNLTMRTMCVIALSVVCYIMFEIDFLCGV